MVTDDGLKYLTKLTNLEELDLSGARVSDKGIEYLRNLKNMRVLNLRSAQATDASLEILAGMPNLRSVDLYRTKITNAGLAQPHQDEPRRPPLQPCHRQRRGPARRAAAGQAQYVGRLPKSANAGAAQARRRDPSRPSPTGEGHRRQIDHGSRRLRSIDLATTPVSDAQLAFLAKVPELEQLNLQATQIGDLGLQSLETLPRLRVLDVSNTTVSDAGLARIAKIKTLESVRIAGTLVEGQLAANLRELDLGNTKVDKAFWFLSSLRSHCAAPQLHTEISDAGMKQLSGPTKLESLHAGSDTATNRWP